MVLAFHGVPTAPFAVVSHLDAHAPDAAARAIARSPYAAQLHAYPLFAKPASVSDGIGISAANKITRPGDLERVVGALRAAFPADDVLLERFLGGREFTVGVVGTGRAARAVGVRELVYLANSPLQPIDPRLAYADAEAVDPVYRDIDIYSREQKGRQTRNPQAVDHDMNEPVPRAVAAVALQAWAALGLRDGGRLDIRYDSMGPDAVPHVIEINPIPGMTPGWSDYPGLAAHNGITYDDLIALIISSAMERKPVSTVSNEAAAFCVRKVSNSYMMISRGPLNIFDVAEGTTTDDAQLARRGCR
ncbi:hypothetical protein HWV62_30863 [Athelia sp. TMB]|nr:hypothetical protein HWV62_30863 [Athelia sp. TMB]